jgi:hypothetical protein
MVWYANSEGRYGANGAKGDLGERIVKEYCQANNILYEEKSDLHSQVNLKIDCIIDGIPVDVKSNYFKGYLVVEVHTRKNKPGWIYTTTAEQIYGVDVDTKSIYRYNVLEMREYIDKVKPVIKKTKTFDYILYIHVSNELIHKLQ